MNFVDLLLVVIVLLGAWTGWRRGFVRAALFLATVVAALLVAFLTYRWPAAWLESFATEYGAWMAPLSFVVIFVAVQLLLDVVAHRIISAVPARVHAHGLNALLGLAPGVVNGAINAAVVGILLLALPLPDRFSREAQDSAVADVLSQPAQWLEARLAPIFSPAIRRTLQALTVPPESKTTVRLPYQVAAPKVRADLEARMLELVNDERAKQGLRPVKADPQVTEVARAHSRDMFARGYFSHYTPEGGSLGDRLRKQDVRYLVAGENLALASTLNRAHQGLMDSPGHRANILRPQFGRAGIGVLDGGQRGLMITQNFRN